MCDIEDDGLRTSDHDCHWHERRVCVLQEELTCPGELFAPVLQRFIENESAILGLDTDSKPRLEHGLAADSKVLRSSSLQALDASKRLHPAT